MSRDSSQLGDSQSSCTYRRFLSALSEAVHESFADILLVAGNERAQWQSRRSKFCVEMQELQGMRASLFFTKSDCDNILLNIAQREHSANIREAPKSYEQSEPPKIVNILEFDCRGLEFTEFRADVCHTTCQKAVH